MAVTVIGNKLQVELLADESTKTQLNEIQQEVRDLEERLEERLDERLDRIIAGTVEDVSGAEIVDARQGEASLGANITKVKSKLAETTQQIIAEKADITYVDEQIANVADGSPKGAYETLTALQTAYPTGAPGIYVVTADGNWYYWSEIAWVAGGIYQSTLWQNALTTQNQVWEEI